MVKQTLSHAFFSFGRQNVINDNNTPFSIKHATKIKILVKLTLGNNIFIIFATKNFNMTLQKWIKDRAIHGYPTFSIEDVRETGMYSSEQIMKNELNRLCSNKTIANVYRGFYVIIPVHYVLRGSVPATYYIDQLMAYLNKPYYVCMLSAAELLGVAHQRPQRFSVMTTYPRRQLVTTRNITTDWFYRNTLPEGALITKNTETGVVCISNPLLTAADLVQNQQHVGGLSRVATILEELTEQIDIGSQFPTLISYVKTVTWQRLGYILENVIEDNETADKLYEQLRTSSACMVYKPLSTSAEINQLNRDSRWKININVEIETDDI